MKILIVDDSVFAQQYTKNMVRKYIDAEFLFAASGEIGYHMFMSEKPDIIISDLLMPGIGGQGMIEKIRKVDKECKIIVVSSDIQKAVKEEIAQLGVLGFINKPLNDEGALKLIDAIGGMI